MKITAIVPKYLETRYWPIVASAGIERTCGENYGDIECGFCDFVLCPEGKMLRLHDKCKRCGAQVVRFKDLKSPVKMERQDENCG